MHQNIVNIQLIIACIGEHSISFHTICAYTRFILTLHLANADYFYLTEALSHRLHSISLVTSTHHAHV